jgi:hypothetical protein
MACLRCDTPLQGWERGGQGLLPIRPGSFSWRWWLLCLVLAAAALAAVAPGSRQPFSPHGFSDRANDRWQ